MDSETRKEELAIPSSRSQPAAIGLIRSVHRSYKLHSRQILEWVSPNSGTWFILPLFSYGGSERTPLQYLSPYSGTGFGPSQRLHMGRVARILRNFLHLFCDCWLFRETMSTSLSLAKGNKGSKRGPMVDTLEVLRMRRVGIGDFSPGLESVLKLVNATLLAKLQLISLQKVR